MSEILHTIYVDESGFTGEDLLSETQPIFCYAATDLSDADANELIADIFPQQKSSELKFTRIRRNRRHRARVAALVETMAGDAEHYTTWVAHKEFALVTLIVDWWMEPLAKSSGQNLYKDGANLAMANMLYVCLEGFWNRRFRRNLLSLFQTMFRSRSSEAFSRAELFIRKEQKKVDGDREEVLRYFWPTFVLLGEQHLQSLPDRVLDLALPGLTFLGHNWRQRLSGPMRVIHDESSNIAKQKWLWDALSSPDLPEAQFSYPSADQVFPMNVRETEFGNSASKSQLQICDLLAGATNTYLKNFLRPNEDMEFIQALEKAGIEDLIVGNMWPGTEVSPEELGTKGWDGNVAIEWIAEQLQKPHKQKLDSE